MSSRRWQFRWNDWNLDHIAGHGVTSAEVESVIFDSQPPFPEQRGDGKWGVWGQAEGGRYLQVLFVHDDPETDDIYVIHARPLNRREIRQFRKRIR
jgi:uncharacterized DUF497 family protein